MNAMFRRSGVLMIAAVTIGVAAAARARSLPASTGQSLGPEQATCFHQYGNEARPTRSNLGPPPFDLVARRRRLPSVDVSRRAPSSRGRGLAAVHAGRILRSEGP